VPSARLGDVDHPDPELVRVPPDVIGHAAPALVLADARGERAPRELRHAILHEALILGQLEVDHHRLRGCWARPGAAARALERLKVETKNNLMPLE
jgi:hypothetical protein